jgi:hypothetical protein
MADPPSPLIARFLFKSQPICQRGEGDAPLRPRSHTTGKALFVSSYSVRRSASKAVLFLKGSDLSRTVQHTDFQMEFTHFAGLDVL